MTCASCGAQVRALDTTCGSCGTALPAAAGWSSTAVTPPAPATPPIPAAVPARATTAEQSDPHPRATHPTKVVAIAVVAIVAAIGLGVSRAQVSGRLGTTRIDLANASAQLTAANAHVESLEQRVHEQEVAQGQLTNQRDDARAEADDARTSLDACQDVFRMAAAGGNSFTQAEWARIQSKLNTCFEGSVPPSIYR